MSFPDCRWPLDCEVPEYDPTVRIAGEQAQILPEETHAVYLGSMSAKNVVGLSWW